MFTLNTMQTKVFKLLTNHYKGLWNNVDKRLLLAMGRITETKKSYVLMVFKKILESFNHGHWILVDLLTNVVSNNIDGSMLHSLIDQMPKDNIDKMSSLQKIWVEKQYFFINFFYDRR